MHRSLYIPLNKHSNLKMETNKIDIVVFGSCMIDLICYAPRLPNKGETLHGTHFQVGNGGKGANQCVAAAKLGASTALIARLGDDPFGRNYVKSLTSYDVNVDHIIFTNNISSGIAQITVSEAGENHIVIVSGANSKLTFGDARSSGETLLGAKVVLFQMETPLEATLETLKYIKEKNGPKTIVNAAPAIITNLNEEIYKYCDILCVNETEAEILSGIAISSIKNAFAAIDRLIKIGCHSVIITLGAQGSVYGGENIDTEHVSTDPVKAVDSTGAGDAFLGALAYYVAKMPNISLKEKIRRASKIATYSVMHKGTQASFPLRSALDPILFED